MLVKDTYLKVYQITARKYGVEHLMKYMDNIPV